MTHVSSAAEFRFSNVRRVPQVLDPKSALVAVAQREDLERRGICTQGRCGSADCRPLRYPFARPRDAFALGHVPQPSSVTSQELAARGVSAPFTDYLQPFGLVASS